MVRPLSARMVTFASIMPLESIELAAAIQATFERRDTALNNSSLYIFSDEFKTSVDIQKQWQVFINKNNLATKDDFKTTVEMLQALLEPIYFQINSEQGENKNWNVEAWCWR